MLCGTHITLGHMVPRPRLSHVALNLSLGHVGPRLGQLALRLNLGLGHVAF